MIGVAVFLLLFGAAMCGVGLCLGTSTKGARG